MLCILKTTVGTNPRGVLHLILISLAVERIEKHPDKAWNDRKRGSSNIMYSLGMLIVDLETARRRLLYVFEVPDGTATSGLRTRPIPDGPLPNRPLDGAQGPIGPAGRRYGGFSWSLQTPRNRSKPCRMPTCSRRKRLT